MPLCLIQIFKAFLLRTQPTGHPIQIKHQISWISLSQRATLNYLHIEPATNLFSDHSSIILTLSSVVIFKYPRHTLSNKRTNWEKFQEIIESTIKPNLPLKTLTEIKILNIFTC